MKKSYKGYFKKKSPKKSRIFFKGQKHQKDEKSKDEKNPPKSPKIK